MKTKVSKLSIYIRPLIYVALTAYFALSLQIWQMAVVILSFILGRIAGRMLTKDLIVKKQGKKIHYDRHPIIFWMWVIALVLRIVVDIFFKIEIAVFAMTAILAISTGMIVSESKFIHLKLRRPKRKSA